MPPIIPICSWFAMCQFHHLHSPPLLAGPGCLCGDTVSLNTCHLLHMSACLSVTGSLSCRSLAACRTSWCSKVSYHMSLNASHKDSRGIKKSAIKMERSRSCWVRPEDKKGLWASEAVFTPPPFCACPLSPSFPPFTLLSPWTEDWHSVEDTPG